LGKSESDLKLELPSALKKALEELAGARDQALSDYIRGALARELLPEAEWLNLQHQESDQ
jgi:predicted transcriptional regulator